MSIFSMSEELAEEDHPPIPDCPEWSTIERCRYEKEVISTYLSGHPLDDFRDEMELFTNIGVSQLASLDSLAGREVHFGGLVSGCKGGVSSKGSPYGSMVIDDYSGSYELRLYDSEYTDFKNFFTDDTFIYCRALVRSSTYKDKKTGADRTFIRLKILSMSLLGKVMDKFTAKLAFTMNLKDVNEEFCKQLVKMARKNRGDVPLQAIVVDPVYCAFSFFGVFIVSAVICPTSKILIRKPLFTHFNSTTAVVFKRWIVLVITTCFDF